MFYISKCLTIYYTETVSNYQTVIPALPGQVIEPVEPISSDHPSTSSG